MESSLVADGPLAVLATSAHTSSEDNKYAAFASQMTVVHNMLIHGYNSIYRQAPHVKPADVPDFLQYCIAWLRVLHKHHAGEEEVLFPMLQEITGKKDIMDDNITEHRILFEDLGQFEEYLDAMVQDPAQFKGSEMTTRMDGFSALLGKHLAEEPPRLEALAAYNVDLEPVAKALADHSMKDNSTLTELPILWFNLDRDFEGGRWSDFPPVPAPVKWMLINVVARWYQSWWRFGSSDAKGTQRPLLCLTPEYQGN